MFVLNPGARLDFIQSPAATGEAFKSVNSNEHAVIHERCFKDRLDGRVGNERFRARDGLTIVVMFGIVDENAARPQQPRLEADLDTQALDGAWKRFLCRFRKIDILPEPLRTLTARHVAGLR